MQAAVSSAHAGSPQGKAQWSAVLAMSLGAFVLVASEFMPVSLLTPVATDLNITEGQAGQAISVSGGFALLTSLFISSLTARLDRKILLVSLTLLMILSGTVAAFAPNYPVFLTARALIGVAIGGFWSMSAAIAMRMVPDHHVPRALAIVNGGNALATVVAAPLGSYLGALAGWRWAFFCLVPVAVLALIWKLVSLPRMTAQPAAGVAGVFRLMRRPVVVCGMAAASLFFMGQFALFTYLRPFLETVTGVDATTLSMLLLLLGVAGFIGTTLVGGLLQRHLYRTLTAIPTVMALLALALTVVGSSAPITGALLGLWGLIATAAPVGWWTWMARTLPGDAEAGGGLMVALVQLAIAMGATVGGLLYDGLGYRATFCASAALLLLAAAAAWQTSRTARTPARAPQVAQAAS